MAAMLTYLSNFFSGEADPLWPHVVLLTVSVLSSFAVAGGIILESPKYSASVHRIATWLVIGGVAIEALCTIFLFVFDEGISNAQQEKIIALERRLASRGLSPDQIVKIREKLVPFSGTSFEMGGYWTVREPKELADQISRAIIDARWTPVLLQDFPLTVISGVLVTANSSGGTEQEGRAADALVAALNEQGISAERTPNENIQVNPTRIAVRILVGLKP